jgi:hypothetical protein
MPRSAKQDSAEIWFALYALRGSIVALLSGRSVVWLARLFRVQEVVSSNLTAPTIFKGFLQAIESSTYFATIICIQTTFPMQITKKGVSVTIGKVKKADRSFFRVLYREQGKRKQAWRSTFEGAKRTANEAIEATLTGDHSALKLTNSDRHIYLRAVEILQPHDVPLV